MTEVVVELLFVTFVCDFHFNVIFLYIYNLK